MVRTYALDPVVSQSRVVEPSLLLNRQVWKSLDKRCREQATTRSCSVPAVTMYLHTLQPTTRRVLLEDIPAEALTGKLIHSPSRVRPHRVGMIRLGPNADQMNAAVSLDKMNRLARRAHTDLNLGAHGNPFDTLAERIGQEPVSLMSAVVTDLVTQQTR